MVSTQQERAPQLEHSEMLHGAHCSIHLKLVCAIVALRFTQRATEESNRVFQISVAKSLFKDRSEGHRAGISLADKVSVGVRNSHHRSIQKVVFGLIKLRHELRGPCNEFASRTLVQAITEV